MTIPFGALITQAANARTAFSGGKAAAQKQGQDDQLQQTLMLMKLKQDQQKDALSQALGQANIGHLNAETHALDDKSDIAAQVFDNDGVPWNRHKDGTLSRAAIRGDTPAPPPKPNGPTGDINLSAGDSQDMGGGGDVSQAPAKPTLAQALSNPPAKTPKFGARPPNPATIPGTPEALAAKEAEAKITAKYAYHPPERDSFTFPVVTDSTGHNVVGRGNTRTGELTPTNIGAKADAATTKLTEPQEKSHLFYKLMADSDPLITAAMTSGRVRKGAVSAYINAPDAGKPLVQSQLNPQEQSLIRSFKDFAAGVLRKESGAAVTTGELKEVWERYGPGFGDNPQLDVEKANARASYMETMKQQAGPALKFYESQSKGGGRGGQAPASGKGSNTVTVNGKTFKVPD